MSVHSQRVAFIVVNLIAIIEAFVSRNLVVFGMRVLIWLRSYLYYKRMRIQLKMY